MPERDIRWDIYDLPQDFDEFGKVVTANFYFNPQIQEEVLKHFKRVKRLLELSFFEYELYDMALERTLFLFEMVLNTRHKEITGTDMKDPKLKKLMTWFKAGKYFEVDNDAFLDAIRNIRNSFAHPKEYTVGGCMLNQWITNIIDLINDTYECTTLRTDRLNLYERWQSQLEQLCEDGAVYKAGDQIAHISLGDIGFINNKQTPATIQVFLTKQVALTDAFYENIGSYNHDMAKIICSNIETGHGFMKLLDAQGVQIGVIEQLLQPEKEQHKDLEKRINEIKIRAMYEHIFYSDTQQEYMKARQHFHKLPT